MKTFLLSVVAALLLISFTEAADAARKRTRITVHPRTPITERPIYQHPFAVDFVLRSVLCSFHVFSVGPQGKPGSCAQYLPQPTPHRVV